MMIDEIPGFVGETTISGDPAPERQMSINIALIRGKDM